MSKRTVSGMVLIPLLIGMVILTFDIQPVKASETIYIRADGRVDPPTAPISSVDNVTYTFTGNAYDSVVVERSNIIVDGNTYTVQGGGSGKGFSLRSISNVTIKNTNIKGFFYGIYFNFSSNSSITENTITANDNGIEFTDSSNNSISGNKMTLNRGTGILLTRSSYNNISRNNVTSNDYGIYVYSSSNCNSISENNLTANRYYGIILDSSLNCNVIGNTVTANNNGIRLIDSSNNTLRGNVMAYNKYNFEVWGLTLTHFLNDVDFSNTADGKPIYYLINKQDKEVPSDAGYIALANCTRITIQNLNLTNNGQGILLAYTTSSTITKNNITNNYFGIRLRDSSNNSIYHNSFVSNTNQASTYNSVNAWDDGYPSGGNYWSDCGGADLYRGPYQNITGSDGIGDTPRVLSENIQDNYPLMKPYGGPFDIGITNITTSKTVVGQGYKLDVNITILNYGINAETFNITAYANATIIATITSVTLASRNSTTITLFWNTSGFAKGDYAISAVAGTVPGETDTKDNLLVDGQVFVLSLEHDVAIRSLTSRPIIGQGYTSLISVTAMDVGNYVETFNVTVYVNATYIASQDITLVSGASTVITFFWNTSGFAKGDYAISAVAGTVPGETDTKDNNCTNGWILITTVGDLGGPVSYVPTFFACDGKVDGFDLALFIHCYKGLASSETMYLGDLGGSFPPQFFECDGVVDGKDLALWIQCYKGLGP